MPATHDDFESVTYDLDYKSEKGGLSKYIKARYCDGTEKDIQIDGITQTQPRLWAVKQEVLKIMDDYNATFILRGAFQTVFFLLTLGLSIEPVAPLASSRPRYSVVRRTLPKSAPTGAKPLESEGAIKPGSGSRTHTDPFTGETNSIMATAKTERSMITSIRADVAESQAYGTALQKGEIGLQRPTGANVQGADFITATLREGSATEVDFVIATDVKATTTGRVPVPKATMPGSWRVEVNNAVAPGRLKLGNPVLEDAIRAAVKAGRVRLRQVSVNYSSAGQGSITGL